MTMVRGQYSQALAPAIDSNFVEFIDLEHRSKQYDKVFNVSNTTRAFEDEVHWAGTGPMPEKTEGENVAYFEIVQGGTKRYIPLSYAMAFRISWELYEDALYNIIQQAPKAGAHSATFTEEMVPWNIFNNGFSGFVTTDGVSLFNNQHPLLGGAAATTTGPGLNNVISAVGTYPNRPATDLDLSFTSLQLMREQFLRIVDSMGLPITIKPTMLLIPPELESVAIELLGSPGKPYTANNEVNALQVQNLQYMIVNFFTSGSAWFAVTEKQHHQLKFKWRQTISTDFDDDFDTRSIKMMTYMRLVSGATHWLGTYGSNGP